jgi:hypothetical protein
MTVPDLGGLMAPIRIFAYFFSMVVLADLVIAVITGAHWIIEAIMPAGMLSLAILPFCWRTAVSAYQRRILTLLVTLQTLSIGFGAVVLLSDQDRGQGGFLMLLTFLSATVSFRALATFRRVRSGGMRDYLYSE